MGKQKSKIELLVNKKYREILKYMQNALGNDSTFSNDLQRLAIQLFGDSFKGVYASNKIPDLNEIKKYAIINLDNSNQPGSHWVAVAYSEETDSIIFYDSFGRHSKKILPEIHDRYIKVVDTDSDAEQRIKENNCGQRALAWLLIYDRFGKNNAMLV